MKPIELFEAGDFEGCGMYVPAGLGMVKMVNTFSCADSANAKLNSWLKSAVRVYGFKSDVHGFLFSYDRNDKDTHQALLVCVEELLKKECEHEIRMHLGLSNDSQDYWADCKKCGVKLAPTGWKAVE